MLSNTWYDNEPLLNYLVYNDYDYLSNTDYLEGYEEFGLPQRALLYPFIDEMSQGERSLLEYTAMNRMITFGLMDEDAWSSTDATMQDPEFGAVDMEECSVYANVNRDDFKVGSIAVTNMAQGKEATTGETMSNGVGSGVSVLSVGLTVGGVAVTVAGTVLAIKNWNTGANAVNQVPAVTASTQEAVKQISLATKKLRNTLNINGNEIDMYKLLSRPDSFIIGQYNKNINQYTKILTQPGADSIMFSPVFNADAKTITLCNGTQFDYSGDTMKMTYAAEYDVLKKIKDMQQPDLVKAAGNNITKEAYESAKEFISENNFTYSNTTIDNIISLEDLDQEPAFLADLQAMDTNLNDFGDKYIKDLSDEELIMVNKHVKNSENITTKRFNKYCEAKETTRNYNSQKAANQVDEMVDQSDDLAENADDAMTAATGSPFWKWFGVGMAIIGLAMSAYGVYSMISEMKAYYHVEMLPIPRKMVDVGYQADGSSCYLYYDCVKCNRSEQGMSNDTLEDYGDLNGDVMKQWLALYTTKDRRAGSPITESLVVKKGTTSMPLKTKPLSFFGFESAVNMTDKNYTYNDKKNGIYLYYKVDNNASYTGTVTTNGMLATVGVLSGLGGAGICAALMTVFGRRRRKAEAPAA